MNKENARGMRDDMISRRAAIEVVQNRHMMLSKEKVLLINDLEKLPSTEPRRGKWIDKGVYTDVDYYKHLYECDQCGNGWLDTTDFCPHCGADMRGEQDG